MVHIHDVGTHDGRPYMAMELVEGKSLDKVISERSLTVNDCLIMMKSWPTPSARSTKPVRAPRT